MDLKRTGNTTFEITHKDGTVYTITETSDGKIEISTPDKSSMRISPFASNAFDLEYVQY